MESATMAKKQKDVLMDHSYDGIRELDNDLPPWWLYLFYFTIAFAVVYMLYYHVLGIGDSSAVEYQKEINPNYATVQQSSKSIFSVYHSPYYNPRGDISPRIRKQFDEYIGPNVDFKKLVMEAMIRGNAAEQEKLKKDFPDIWAELTAASGGKAPTAQPETKVEAAPAQVAQAVKTYKPLTDQASLAKGKEIFQKNCVSCHGPQGQGLIGPNLTDDYWIHGAGMSNVVHTIIEGVPAKGMISWRGVLKEDEILQVASYILTLHGTNPPNPKAPQGEKVEYPLKGN